MVREAATADRAAVSVRVRVKAAREAATADRAAVLARVRVKAAREAATADRAAVSARVPLAVPAKNPLRAESSAARVLDAELP